MKLTKLSAAITAILLVCAAIFTSTPAQASLSARYESKVGKSQPAPQPKAQQLTGTGATLLSSKKLSKKYTAAIKKNQQEFYTAMVNAEMGLRSIFAAYKGYKEPSDAQFKEMKFAAELLIKDAQASARRYAQDLRLAKIAMLRMNEEERTAFAKALGLILASPAYAAGINADAMDRIASALNNIAASTPNIDERTVKDIMRAKQEKDEAEGSFHKTVATICTVGIIGASATKVTTTAAGTLVGMATGGPIGGTAALIGGVSATTLSIVDLTDEIKDAAGTSNKKTAGEKDTLGKMKTVAAVAGAVGSFTSLGELTKNVTNSSGGREAVSYIVSTTIDSTQTVDSLKEIISQTPDAPDAPGAAGVKAVQDAGKKAGNDNSGGNGGGSGSGGSSGGGNSGGGGGCGCK